MKIKWLGHSCFEIALNDGRVIVTDPYDDTVGYPPLKVKADVVLSSHDHFDHNYFDAVEGRYQIINAPGAYPLGDATITGTPSYHDEVRGAKRGRNTIFSIEAEGMKIVHLGDLGHLPDTEAQREALSGVDVLLIPIGGTFTITTPEAVKLIDEYRPAAAIAMHYKNRYCGFDIDGDEGFIAATGAKTLPNAVDVEKGTLKGCYVMEI